MRIEIISPEELGSFDTGRSLIAAQVSHMLNDGHRTIHLAPGHLKFITSLMKAKGWKVVSTATNGEKASIVVEDPTEDPAANAG